MNTFSIGIHSGGYSKQVNTEDGPIDTWVDVFTIMAQDTTGRRWVMRGFPTNEEAQAALLTLASSTPETAPAAWEETDPAYGSEAWGDEDEYNLACFDADCFNEPRPQWG